MKFFILLIVTVFLCNFSSAQDKPKLNLCKEALQEALGSALVSNGFTAIFSFDPTDLTITEAKRNIEKLLPNGRAKSADDEDVCKYQTSTSEETTFKKWKRTQRDEEKRHGDPKLPSLIPFIEQLKESGQVLFAVSRTYKSGETETCLHYYYEIYLKNGFHLRVAYGFTD